jgi:hypothetical protein
LFVQIHEWIWLSLVPHARLLPVAATSMTRQRNPVCFAFFLILALMLFAPLAKGQALTPAWVELGEDGKAIARIVVTSPRDCPPIVVDGNSRPMIVREHMPAGFRPACEFTIPSGTRTAALNGHSLALPKPDPERVAVIGDTGCRIKGRAVQDCNHAQEWPFLQVAQAAAGEKADLVVHVGDYLYRESPCPEDSRALCGGSPAGDNWDAWNADFFTPAASLLSAAPWAFSRGNHEDCNRTWRGWFYYLDPQPWDGVCADYPPAYLIKLGKFQLAMLDSTAVQERQLDEKQMGIYAAELASLHPQNAWLATHYPFWGFVTDSPSGRPVPLVATLEAAWESAAPSGYTLILGGHIHLFEYVSLDQGRPPQILAGDAGTRLDVPIDVSVKGTEIRGARVVAGQSRSVFGYILLTRQANNWRLELKDQRRKVLVSCAVPGSSDTCQSEGTD